MGDVHIDISTDDNARFALYAGGVFELMIGSFSINMNAHQFQQLCDNLRPWIVDDSAPPAAAGSADEPHVFNCRRCPVSVESRWQPPDCPECGQPCALDTSAKPAAAQQPPPAAVSEELLAAAEAVVARWDSPLWKDQPNTGELIHRLRNALAEQAPPAAVPEGYALVPVEPTPEMVEAGEYALYAFTAKAVYGAMVYHAPRAMLAAADKENNDD